MKHWASELNMPKVSWTVCHTFLASLAFKITIYGSKPWVKESSYFWVIIFHSFWVFNLGDRHCSLSPFKIH